MRLLLDAHALPWMLQALEKLSAKVAQAHDDEDTALFVSVASLWEIQIKHALGKLELDITSEHVLKLDELPRHRGDPFDRMIIAQARVKQMPLGSSDLAFEHYPVERFWQLPPVRWTGRFDRSWQLDY